MKRYDHYPGDYAKDTAHLTLTEHGAYRRLLDVYYSTEQPIPDDRKYRLAGAVSKKEREAVRTVLEAFFGQKSGTWVHQRVEQEIAKYRARIDQARANGKQGGRPKRATAADLEENQTLFDKEPTSKPNQEPKHEAAEKAPGGGGNNNKKERDLESGVACPPDLDLTTDQKTNLVMSAGVTSHQVDALVTRLKTKFLGSESLRMPVSRWRNYLTNSVTSEINSRKNLPPREAPPKEDPTKPKLSWGDA